MCDRVRAIRLDAALIVELPETLVVLAEDQGCRGWCILILKDHVEHLAGLDEARQLGIFGEAAAVAAAIRAVFPDTGKDGGPPRINYECLGNLVPHIHWHIIPRHADDPEPTKTVWTWPEAQLKGSMTDAERTELIQRLRAALE